MESTDLGFAALYLLMCPMQELVVRGALQSSLAELLAGQPYAPLQAILLSNAMFAATHAHLSPVFSVVSFFPGLVWGILYYRQGSLLGVSICHMIIGVYALEPLGFDRLIRTL